jgi:type IV pilus assembly protein PilX
MNTRFSSRLNPKLKTSRQQGAVLVISLLLLLVMTLLGLGASQSTRLQERMAGNQRDQEVALQGAEASLRAAEALLSPTIPVVVTCRTPGGAACAAYEMQTLVDGGNVALDLANQADSWWTRFGRQYMDASGLSNVAGTPEFVSERVAEARDVLSVGGPGLDVVRDFYRATARSSGMTPTAQVVVQSTYARIGFE